MRREFWLGFLMVCLVAYALVQIVTGSIYAVQMAKPDPPFPCPGKAIALQKAGWLCWGETEACVYVPKGNWCVTEPPTNTPDAAA